MKYNYRQDIKGCCKSCGDNKQEFRIETKGKRKGDRFPVSKFYKVFEEVSWMRGDDEYLGTFCKNCFKAKKYQPNPS